jgi:hypothetical protein
MVGPLLLTAYDRVEHRVLARMIWSLLVPAGDRWFIQAVEMPLKIAVRWELGSLPAVLATVLLPAIHFLGNSIRFLQKIHPLLTTIR